MSHFVVMVTRTDEEPLDAQLEPFNEQGDEYDYYMEKKYFLERNEKDVESWLDERLQDYEKSIKELKAKKKDEREYDYLKWCLAEAEDIKKAKAVKDLDKRLEFINKYEGGGMDEKGLYWVNNPNAKWDWWVEGGRWGGWLVKKNGERCNRCLVKELDFEGMKKAELEDRAKWYDEAVKEAKENNRKPVLFGFKETPTKEEYVNRKVCLSPYAVLHNGEWIEKGSMGWWGVDDPHYTEEDWEKKFQEFFKTLDPETEVTIVDCHI